MRITKTEAPKTKRVSDIPLNKVEEKILPDVIPEKYKYTLKFNVIHNGKEYKQGFKFSETHEDFEDLKPLSF